MLRMLKGTENIVVKQSGKYAEGKRRCSSKTNINMGSGRIGEPRGRGSRVLQGEQESKKKEDFSKGNFQLSGLYTRLIRLKVRKKEMGTPK